MEKSKPSTGGGWKRWVKRGALGFLALALLVGAGGGTYGYVQTSTYDASMSKIYDVPPLPLVRSTEPAVIARGKHLASSLAGCALHDCHGGDLGGGATIDMGPVASLVAPNITPSNIAAGYSDGELGRLIRHGIKKDGRSAKFMPVQDMNWLPDAELVALISYVRSVAPVDRPNSTTEIKPFGKVLDRKELMVFDVARHVARAPLDFGPSPAPTPEYGRFVARLCAGCHGEHFGGGPLPGAPPDFAVPLNLTPDPTGLKGWTYEDFERVIATGLRKNGAKMKPLMPVEALAQMDDVERHALWAYLQSLPPMPFGSR